MCEPGTGLRVAVISQKEPPSRLRPCALDTDMSAIRPGAARGAQAGSVIGWVGGGGGPPGWAWAAEAAARPATAIRAKANLRMRIPPRHRPSGGPEPKAY